MSPEHAEHTQHAEPDQLAVAAPLTLGGWLTYLRRRAHWTQLELAEAAHLAAETISHIERGVVRAARGRGRGADGTTRALLVQALQARFADLARARGSAHGLTLDEAAELSDQAAHLLSAVPGPAPRHTLPSEAHTPVAAPPPTPHHHNLPVPPTALLGREQEVGAVRARLAEPETRLLTLVGMGGVGKTRLALAVGAAALGDYPAGVWLVELASLADPTLLPSSVASALGLREEPHRPLLATLVDVLADQHLLLLLDNCEHLLAACADLVSRLLRACPALRVLATSREGLEVSGEQIYRVPPLRVPAPHSLPPLELLGGYGAVCLFVTRAQARRRHFVLSPDTAGAVVEICRRLDGLPLAIELAAARVGSLPVADIARRLDGRFGLLTGGPRDSSPRQQTLRATLDWSWALLGAEEQALLRQLSVFVGGCTLDAAEAVCGEEDAGRDAAGGTVLDLLAGLVDKSLVEMDAREAEARYRLLETVRQYAAERLAEMAAGVAAAVRGRHLDWCVAMAEQAEPHLTRPGQERWLARLEDEHENLRAAQRWAQQCGAPERGVRLAAALWRFWYTRGYLSEGRRWLEVALAGNHGTSTARACALEGAGVLAFQQGDFERAVDLHRRGLVLWRTLGDRRGTAAALTNLGHVASEQGDYARAVALYEESLTLQRALDDTQGLSTTLSALGIVADLRGDYGRALALHEESLALRRALGDKQAIAKSLNNLGIVAKKRGDYARAVALYEECLALQRALGDKKGLAVSLNNLGGAAQMQGDLARATAALEESLALYRELGDRQGLAIVLGSLGVVTYMQGDPRRALAALEESAALERELGDRQGLANSLGSLGMVTYMQGHPAQAAPLFAEGLRISRDIGAKNLVADGLEGLAWVAVAQGQAWRAARLGGAAAARREGLGVPLAPERRAGHEHMVQALRASLGETTYAVAWSEGQAMLPEVAIRLALADAGAPE